MRIELILKKNFFFNSYFHLYLFKSFTAKKIFSANKPEITVPTGTNIKETNSQERKNCNIPKIKVKNFKLKINAITLPSSKFLGLDNSNNELNKK